jgi:hypothetical protein
MRFKSAAQRRAVMAKIFAKGYGRVISRSSTGDRPIYRIPREEYQIPLTEGNFDAYIKRVRDWEASVEGAISEGLLSTEEAHSLGYRAGGDIASYGGWKEMPSEVLYHVTTAKSKVEQEGLKSRRELQQESGKGLGGGSDTAISFTTDPKWAAAIEQGIREMKDISEGKLTIPMMMKMAGKGEGTEGKSYFTRLMDYWHYKKEDKGSGKVPPAVKDMLRGIRVSQGTFGGKPSELPSEKGAKWSPVKTSPSWVGGDGKRRYTQWQRKLTPAEKIDDTVNFYKWFAMVREEAGGVGNPLFFMSDVSALKNLPSQEIAILKFRPKKGARGYQMGALGEWRTKSGKAVELIS